MRLRDLILVPAIISSMAFNTLAQDHKQPEIRKVYVASRGDNGFASNENKTINYETPVNLYAVASTDSSGKTLYFSDSDSLIIDGRVIPKGDIRRFPSYVSSSWFKVENDSRGTAFSNASKGYNWDHWDELDYAETPLGLGNTIHTDVSPTILDAVKLNGISVGTMRYGLVLNNGGQVFKSPGIESTFKGGISEKVHRVSVKGNTGNEIVDNAFSLCNNPYIWASSSLTGSKYDNQAERFIGADCADLCVAAARLAGYDSMFYTSSHGLKDQMKVVTCVTDIQPNGVYLNDNHPLTRAKPGDFIQWNGHVGILVEDNKPKGILDSSDKVLHTLFKEPKLEQINTAYGGDFRVLRVRK